MTTAQHTYPALPLPLPQAWRALLALCVGFFMILLDQTIVAVATPALQSELRASYNAVIWVTSVYLLCFAVPLLVTGRLGDRFGPKNIYIAGMVIFTLASLLCGIATTVELLILARALQGLGAALLTPQTMSVINRVFPRHKRGAALGIWGACAGLSTMAGPLLGGVIVSLWSWQWIFWVNIPLGILAIVAAARWVPRFRPQRRPIDALSILLSVAATTCFVYAIQQGEVVAWAAWIWALLAASLLLAYAFIWRQHHLTHHPTTEALLPLQLFRRPSFTWGNVGIVAMGFTTGGMMLPVMMYLQQSHHLSPMRAALTVLPLSLISTLLAPAMGRAVDRYDARPLAAAGFSVMAAGTLALVIAMRPSMPLWAVVAAMVVLGFGNTGVWAPNSAMTLRDLPEHLAGAGSGVFNQNRQLGAVAGAAVIGAVLQIRIAYYGQGAGAQQLASAFGESLIPAVVMLVLGAVASLRSEKSPGGAQPEA